MIDTPLAFSKEEQRVAALKWRSELSADTREQAAQKLVIRALAALDPKPTDIIAGYWPIRSEMDPRPLLFALQKKGHKLALPVIDGDNIIFRAWSFNDSLEGGAFSTSEPPATAREVKPTLILAPLVAFDESRHRLGYGKGYYDKALSRLRATQPVKVIGLAYEGQKLEKIAAEPHDEVLDMIVTEAATYA